MTRRMWMLPALLLAGAAAGEPAAPEAPLLTLPAAVDQALAANPTVAASKESELAAGARVDQSWTGFLPQLLLSMSYRRATMNSAPPPYLDPAMLPPGVGSFLGRTSPDSYNNYAAGVTLNHTVWDFGRTLGSWKAARELLVAAGQDVATTREQIRLNTTLAYYLVLATQEAVAVADETVSQMERHLALARGQAAAGVRQRIDVARAETDLASARLNASKAKNADLIARVNLAALMGQDAAPDFRLERPPPGQAPDTASLEALVRTALAQRPDVQSLRARARASGDLVDVARSLYYPSLALSAGASLQGYKPESAPLPYNWYAGLSLTWNALSPVPASAASREAQANERAVLASLRGLELGIRAEVESAALALGEARQRLEPTAALVAASGETLRLAEGRYAAGVGSSIELTDAQAAYTQARLSRIQAEFDVETARARLEKALGVATPGSRG